MIFLEQAETTAFTFSDICVAYECWNFVFYMFVSECN